ncbi:MAG: hypothetical protein P8173_18480 [Gammaproteobacteria bacterium]
MKSLVTIRQPVSLETDKTDKTYSISNNYFLHTVFGDNLTDNRPIVVSFEGNPNNAASKRWIGQPWTEEVGILSAEANNYFSLAVFRPDEAGQYRRQKSRFHALCAVMLDDIGTKVAMERLTSQPSWLLETSAGHHQAIPGRTAHGPV